MPDLTILSCRGANYDPERFGPHQIAGVADLFAGGPPHQPILVHGYNVSQPHLKTTYEHYVKLLGRDAIGYSWPGGDHPLDFVVATVRARDAGYRLRDVLSMRAIQSLNSDCIIS